MTATTLRRARAVALLASVCAVATVTACTGRNDGRKDPYGDANMGAGGPAPAGPAPGQNTDTTMMPAASGAATAPTPTPAPAATKAP